MDRRKITSKINGKKSKGPVTVTGKNWSRRNALKHSLLSKEPNLTVGENREEYHCFIKEGFDHYQPKDFYSSKICSLMLHQLWNLEQVPKIQSGVFAYEILTFEADDEKSKRVNEISHRDFSEQDQKKVKYQNLLLGVAFLKDANSGNALLKLSTYETKIFNKFFQLEKIYYDYMEKKYGRKKNK